MAAAPTREKSDVYKGNMTFYNEVAVSYDTHMSSDDNNELVRQKVKTLFTNAVEPGMVLDFGGGTGLDLEWLLANQYRVIFCEPSECMRSQAINRIRTKDNVTFLENDQADFTRWQLNNPFQVKVDGILADFAVFNCIADIKLLFSTLAQVVKPGGSLITLMLNTRYKKSRIQQLKAAIKSLLTNNATAVVNVLHKKHEQTVYLHTHGAINKASSSYFNLHDSEDVYQFTLFHFIRK